jgi:hypothetical protein
VNHIQKHALFPAVLSIQQRQSTQATRLYHEIAKKRIDFNRIVFGIYRTTAFVTSTIIGATVEQLKKI